MAKRRFELTHLRYSEVHDCPYCGKEVRVAVGPLCTIEGLYRTDETIDAQDAGKELRLRESERAIKRSEEESKLS
jgi:hypothetical protein